MQTATFSKFELLLLRSENELGTSVLLILAWIAACDGSVHELEAKELSEISAASKHGHDVQPFIDLANSRDLDALQLASEIIKRQFLGEKATLFLQMAIGVAIADGYLLPTENHILRFLADLLGVSRVAFNKLFIDVTGRSLPDATDPSTAHYWQSRAGQKHQKPSQSAPDPLASAYAVLGLDFGASTEDVKRAYRRLSQIHHPDSYSQLGDEAVAAATKTFQRLSLAYEYVVKHA